MYSQNDIDVLIEIIRSIVKNNLNKILLFGSYSKGLNKEGSDLDVAIILNKLIKRDEKLNLLNSLWWKAAEKNLMVDFIIKTIDDFDDEKTLPTLSKIIYKEGKVIWQSN